MNALVNEHPMHYEDSGGPGVPVVFLHGIAGSSDDWSSVRRRLPTRVRSIAYDSRGVGGSQAGEATVEYSMKDLVSDLEALLDHLEITQVCLVGASMGGGVAQYFTLEHPTRVSAMVLVSTSSTFAPELRARFLADADRAVRHGMVHLVDDFLDRWYSTSYRQSHPQEMTAVRAQYLAMRPDVFACRCRVNAERELTSRLRELDCPVLVVAGAADPGTDSATVSTYLDEVRGCEATLLGGHSHCVEREAPDRLARLVDSFISSRRCE